LHLVLPLFRIRLPPSPARLPYTTLFRSVDHLGDDAGRLLRNTLGLELLELDLTVLVGVVVLLHRQLDAVQDVLTQRGVLTVDGRSEEHTSELQSRENLVCRLLLEKKKNT